MEVLGIVEHKSYQAEENADHDLDLARRRASLATAFQALPAYGSVEFWSLVEEPELKVALPSIIAHRHCIRNAPSNATLPLSHYSPRIVRPQ
jgi:hypothetical protein